jgi:hypothetical protein
MSTFRHHSWTQSNLINIHSPEARKKYKKNKNFEWELHKKDPHCKTQKEARRKKRWDTMVRVSENSSVRIDMISWFDFTSLHSMTKETHLSLPPLTLCYPTSKILLKINRYSTVPGTSGFTVISLVFQSIFLSVKKYFFYFLFLIPI